MNPLYDAMRAGTGSGMGSGMGGMGNMVQRFRQFQQAFRGDARQQVQQLLNSGRVTQEQYNRAVQIAQQLQGMIR